MESNESPATGHSRDIFRHDPLEHSKPSIRLIRLLPELSSDGIIQCEILHETIEASYMCLSYRWGPPEPSNNILINGQLFAVRQNLLDFLDMARQNIAATTTYWIDALCIDQHNILERNHQVAQMGDIYSRAVCVYVWLGATKTKKDMARALHILRDPESASPQQWGLISALKQDLQDFICCNPYWERAWVVQEIFLARRALVWLDTETIPFEYIHWAIDYFYLTWTGLPIAKFHLSTRAIADPKARISNFEVAKTLYNGASLQFLLGRFHGMKCEQPLDRVFSLSSLCKERNQFPTDYGSSSSTLYIETLKHCSATSCLCMPRLLAESMGLYDNFHNFRTPNDKGPLYIECELPITSFLNAFNICEVDGKRFIIRTPIPWQAFQGYGMCESLDRLVKELPWPRLLTEIDSDFGANSTDLLGKCSGTIEAPSGYTPASYLRDHSSMWVNISSRRTAQAPSQFTLQSFDSKTCTFCAPLSTLHANTLWESTSRFDAMAQCLKTKWQTDVDSLMRRDHRPVQRRYAKWRLRTGTPNPQHANLGRLSAPDYIEHLFVVDTAGLQWGHTI